MNKASFILMFVVLFIGCAVSENNKWENKQKYELAVNEKLPIYITTNSCCFDCISNKDQLKHVKFIEQQMIESPPSGLTGANSTEAFVFEAISVGVDTVKINHVTATEDCENNTAGQSEKYIIEVK